MLLAGLQIPKSSSTTRIKIKPKPVLLEHSWSQVLDKAQKFPKQGDAEGVSGITPSLSSTTGSLGLVSHLPPSAPVPTPGLKGRGRGNGSSGCTLDQQCSIPREGLGQGEAIPYFWGDKELGAGAGILHGHTFHGQIQSSCSSVAQPSCLLPHRQKNSGEGRERSRNIQERPRNIQGCPRKIPALPLTSESDAPLRDPAPASRPIPNPRVHSLGLFV